MGSDDEKKSNNEEKSKMSEDDKDSNDDEECLHKVQVFGTPQRVHTKKFIQNLTLISLCKKAVKIRGNMRK